MPEIPFMYYNDTTGVQLQLPKKLFEELNPLAFSLLKLIFTGIKLPIPDQHFSAETVVFDDVVCHKLRIVKDEEAPGFYLGDGYIGFGIKFDAMCRTRFKSSVPILGPGWANLSLTGVFGNAHIALNYDNHFEMISPKIDEIQLTFNQVQIFVDNSRMANLVTRSLKSVFPRIASALFKQTIKNMIDTMAGQIKTMNFGVYKKYHPIFLYAPFINPQVVRLNVALVEWKKNYILKDNNGQEVDDDQAAQENDVYDDQAVIQANDVDDDQAVQENDVDDDDSLVFFGAKDYIGKY